MSAHIAKVGVSYFSVPKCACTSLKQTFWALENSRPFRAFVVNGRKFRLQQVYETRAFETEAPNRPEGAWTFAIVRDPASRVVSCFRNRVAARKLLKRPETAEKLAAADVPVAPNLSEFVAGLGTYRAASEEIDWHLKPFSFFLGRDAGFFDRVYSLSEIATLAKDLTERFGRKVDIPHRQTAGPKLSRKDLSAAELAEIETAFAEDIEIFGKHF
ncbi:MAG: sulfotransferase family 2 domain-containing protein [Pseudomonadota bacterium]